jgi:hypothetical protein
LKKKKCEENRAFRRPINKWEENIYMTVREIESGVCELDSSGSCAYNYRNETTGSIKGGEFLDEKRDFTPWSWLCY